MSTLRMLISAACLTTASTIALADDITDAANEGLQLYKAGKLNEAAAQWDYASTLARQKKAKQANTLLPAPLPGWKIDDSDSSGFSGGMFGGGITAHRNYSKGDAYVNISLISDNPMIQSMGMMFANPSFAAMSGMRFVTIQGQKALVQNEGDYQLMFQLKGGAALLTVNADGGADNAANAKAYAQKLDFDALNKM